MCSWLHGDNVVNHDFSLCVYSWHRKHAIHMCLFPRVYGCVCVRTSLQLCFCIKMLQLSQYLDNVPNKIQSLSTQIRYGVVINKIQSLSTQIRNGVVINTRFNHYQLKSDTASLLTRFNHYQLKSDTASLLTRFNHYQLKSNTASLLTLDSIIINSNPIRYRY